jgi:hypothetical protein
MNKGTLIKSLGLSIFAAIVTLPAHATDARIDALSGNVGIEDDTDFTTYASETGEVGGNAWMNYDGALTGAVAWDGNAVSINDDNGATMGWYSSSGDTGYSASLGYDNETEVIALGGSWSTADRSDGLANMAFGGGLTMDDDDIGVKFGASSRTLTDDAVTAWRAVLDYSDTGIEVDGNYVMGHRFGDSAAFTYGPGVVVDMPDGGDMAINLELVEANMASEFMFNDWFGLRGSVTGTLALENLTGEMTTSMNVDSAFGATLSSDAAAIDLKVDPAQILGGPYFLTGNASGAAAYMSIRVAI